MQQKDESYVGRILNDPNVRHKNHQLSFLKRLQTRKQTSDTVNLGLESEPEQSAEESVETVPDEKQMKLINQLLVYQFSKGIN